MKLKPKSWHEAYLAFAELNTKQASVNVRLTNTFPNRIEYILVKQGSQIIRLSQIDFERLQHKSIKYLKIAKACGFYPDNSNFNKMMNIFLFANQKARKQYRLSMELKKAA